MRSDFSKILVQDTPLHVSVLCFRSLICSLCLRRGLKWLYGLGTLGESRKVVLCLLRASLLKSLGCLVARCPVLEGAVHCVTLKATPSLRPPRLNRISFTFSSPWSRLVRNPKNQVLPLRRIFLQASNLRTLLKYWNLTCI